MILPLTPAVSDPVGCDIAGIPVSSPLKSPSRPSRPPVSSARAVGRPPARARAQSNPAQALAFPRAFRSA